MRQGDLVVRKSYGGDVIFKIHVFQRQTATLRGVDFRLLADAPINDLARLEGARLAQHEKYEESQAQESLRRIGEFRETRSAINRGRFPLGQDAHSYFEVPGKVLHLDGDPNYLRKSMHLYGQMNVPAEGLYVPENAMADVLVRVLPQVRPDILVITGHDGLIKHRRDTDIHNMGSYKNSHNFVNAVRAARVFERNRDSLVIVAGACQSYFEALLQAGANFASSPARVLIHALDPLYIAAETAFTPIRDTVNVTDVIRHTYSGLEGLGGIESRGCYRVGLPRLLSAGADK